MKIDIRGLSEEEKKAFMCEYDNLTINKCNSNCPFSLDTITYCSGNQKNHCDELMEKKKRELIKKYLPNQI